MGFDEYEDFAYDVVAEIVRPIGHRIAVLFARTVRHGWRRIALRRQAIANRRASRPRQGVDRDGGPGGGNPYLVPPTAPQHYQGAGRIAWEPVTGGLLPRFRSINGNPSRSHHQVEVQTDKARAQTVATLPIQGHVR